MIRDVTACEKAVRPPFAGYRIKLRMRRDGLCFHLTVKVPCTNSFQSLRIQLGGVTILA